MKYVEPFVALFATGMFLFAAWYVAQLLLANRVTNGCAYLTIGAVVLVFVFMAAGFALHARDLSLQLFYGQRVWQPLDKAISLAIRLTFALSLAILVILNTTSSQKLFVYTFAITSSVVAFAVCARERSSRSLVPWGYRQFSRSNKVKAA